MSEQPEIWVREGDRMEIRANPDKQGATLRISDRGYLVTISRELSRRELKSLRRWLGQFK